MERIADSDSNIEINSDNRSQSDSVYIVDADCETCMQKVSHN